MPVPQLWLLWDTWLAAFPTSCSKEARICHSKLQHPTPFHWREESNEFSFYGLTLQNKRMQQGGFIRRAGAQCLLFLLESEWWVSLSLCLNNRVAYSAQIVAQHSGLVHSSLATAHRGSCQLHDWLGATAAEGKCTKITPLDAPLYCGQGSKAATSASVQEEETCKEICYFILFKSIRLPQTQEAQDRIWPDTVKDVGEVKLWQRWHNKCNFCEQLCRNWCKSSWPENWQR